MAHNTVKIFIGHIVHCPKPFALQVLENGFLAIRGNQIIAVDDVAQLDSTKKRLNIEKSDDVYLTKTQILIPGLIDTHIHAPQYPNCGLGYDKPLLEWLDTYTYKMEKKYRDQELANKVFNAVVRKTLDHGTTTACYFASLFGNSSMVLANAAIEKGQRAFIGKVNMTKLAPDDYIETEEETLNNTEEFIKEVLSKENDLVKPVITPRFALSVGLETMKELAKFAKKYDLNIQTHISENVDEVTLVKSTYNMGYAQVYQASELLTSKTILAHGVHLTDEELKLLAERGTSISHCPDSNTCLKSGLCDVRRLIQNKVKVGLGTDVSGGPSPSIVSAMRSAIQTSIHLSHIKENYTPLTYSDAFYLATLGGAEALALQDKIGNFEVGKDFDAILVDADVENSSCDYFLECNALELLQKFVYLADDRNVLQVYVAGRRVK